MDKLEPPSVIAHDITRSVYPVTSLHYRPLYKAIEAAIERERQRPLAEPVSFDDAPPPMKDLVLWYDDGSSVIARWDSGQYHWGSTLKNATHWMVLPMPVKVEAE